VVLTGAARWELAGAGGDDDLSIAGGDGTGAPIGDATVRGGSGADTIRAALDGCVIAGEGGIDEPTTRRAPRASASTCRGRGPPRGGRRRHHHGGRELVGTSQGDRLTGDEGRTSFAAARVRTRWTAGPDDLLAATARTPSHSPRRIWCDGRPEGTSTGNGSDTLAASERQGLRRAM
jgi:hypothetical protein